MPLDSTGLDYMDIESIGMFLPDVKSDQSQGQILNNPEITRIEAQSFKGYPSLSADIQPEVTLMAGSNNAGKSTILHALAVWEFCKLSLLMNSGTRNRLLPRSLAKQGFGIGDDEFSPINLPTLKHLWTQLKPTYGKEEGDKGYTLKITCHWTSGNRNLYLGFKLALFNERLFLNLHKTNLTQEDELPTVAYLPPFAGIMAREEKLSGAARRRRIGQGLAGAVLRNTLLDMHMEYSRGLEELKQEQAAKFPFRKRVRIPVDVLNKFKANAPWHKLQELLREVFQCDLEVKEFNEEYHSYINVQVHKGFSGEDGVFKRDKQQSPRDLMVEGSGFLQWLSVFAVALSGQATLLALDEPDAHLHPHLQHELYTRLVNLSIENKLQILFATHSSEILRHADHTNIMYFQKGRQPRTLRSEDDKSRLFSAIGSVYSPRLDKVRRSKKIFFHEGTSDIALLSVLGKKIGIEISSDWVPWQTTDSHKSRRNFFQHLQNEISGVKAVSLRDRDNIEVNRITESLNDKTEPSTKDFQVCTWKRRYIESYLMDPQSIAIAMNVDISDVNSLFAEEGLTPIENFTAHNVPTSFLDLRAKELLKKWKIKPIDIVRSMPTENVPEDIKTLLKALSS